MNKLFLGDCLEILPTLEDQSIDMILCDLPYGTTACKWDSPLDLKKVFLQYNRVITPIGAIVLFGKEPFSSVLRLASLNTYKYDWIWKKSRKNGYVHAKGMPLQETESLSVFSFGGVSSRSKNKMAYYPQGVIPFTAERINYVKKPSMYQGGLEVGSTWIQEGSMYPTNILTFKSVSPKNQFHSTQKPVSLLEYLIKTYTLPGEVVLDNCMGSGSTGVACANLGRDFIGIEIDENYFKIAESRIDG